MQCKTIGLISNESLPKIQSVQIRVTVSVSYTLFVSAVHWRILVKNIGWAHQNIGARQKVVKSDKCMGVSQLLGGTCPGCPLSLRLWCCRDFAMYYASKAKYWG